MKVKEIFLFSNKGELRSVLFNTNGVNIITGAKSRGKSSIIHIIDYCSGRSECKIASGVIITYASWVGVIYEFENEQILVAKPIPKRNTSCSFVYLERGTNLSPPQFSDLEPNSNDETVEILFSNLMNYTDKKTDLGLNSTKNDFKVSFKHSKYYLFQPHYLIANAESIFYRQAESSFISNNIKETLPVILTAEDSEKNNYLAELREVKRQIVLTEKTITSIESENFQKNNSINSFYNEAKLFGLTVNRNEIDLFDLAEMLDKLSYDLSNEYDSTLPYINNLKRRLQMLRKNRNLLCEELETYKNFVAEKNIFIKNKKIELSRLAAINYLNNTKSMNNEITLINELISNEFAILSDKISRSSIDSSNKKLSILEKDIRNKIDTIDNQIIQLNQDLAKYNSINFNFNNNINNLKNVYMLVGKIRFFIANYKGEDNLDFLKNKLIHLLAKRDRLINKLDGLDTKEEVLDNIIFQISLKISDYLDKLNYEHSDGFTRFDLKKLTLISSTHDDQIHIMNRVGSSANHLFLHLAALLGLHFYFHINKCPVPSFLILDQPSQVYFPEYLSYEKIRENYELYKDNNDIQEVTAVFKFLIDFTETQVKNFQIIILEHAYIDEPWFTDLLIEKQWVNDRALIPESWIQ
ncbi:DUF3732 domain-containing protein [Acinetobacter pittii]|uniref:DUF3732 domain-containing protein n=1 Tax=Acinetobacter pittii TaxID=48296 RepID=UPI0021CD6B6D|nr:DUF3732 domain-containing protein [Acinetobacter pittii]MCU4709991.1 DUF3732 domain-containing protein [Acinetobacter pittii]